MKPELTYKNALEAIRDGFAYDWLQWMDANPTMMHKGELNAVRWENCRKVAGYVLGHVEDFKSPEDLLRDAVVAAAIGYSDEFEAQGYTSLVADIRAFLSDKEKQNADAS